MNSAVTFIPLSEYSIFLHDAQIYHSAILLSGSFYRMMKQSAANSSVPEFRKHGEVSQFAFISVPKQ